LTSPNDTTITPNSGTITDNSGDIFGITNAGTVDMNGAPLGYTANVIDAAYVNGDFWQQNSAGLWWEYTGNPNAPWTGLGTSASPLAGHPSQSGTLISPGSGVITDNQGDTLTTTNSGTIDMNGQPLGYTANVIEAAYVNGHFWQENSSDLWWEYQGSPSAPWTGLGTSASPLPNTLYWGGNGTVSLTGGQTLNFTESPGAGNQNATIHNTGTNTLNANAEPEGTVTLNIAQGGDLKVTGSLSPYVVGANGPGTLTNDGTIDSAWVTIDTNVLGTGTFEFTHWGDSPGSHEISGSSGSGLTYDVGGNTTINDPHAFFSQVNFSDDWPEVQLNLSGLSATSYDLKNDLLTLYQGNAAVYQLKLNASPGFVVQDYAASSGAQGGVSLTYYPNGDHVTGLPEHVSGTGSEGVV
jgi:hypothetical protein